jgi:hypothetical protein
LQSPWNWNVIPRLALAISIIEDGSLKIDKFQSATGDKAYFKGHYYSQAAPGTSLLAIPAVYLGNLYLKAKFEEIIWVNESTAKITPKFIFALQIATIAVSGLFTALTGLALYYVALRLGAGLTGAVLGALSYGLATPAWGWATAFVGHPAASFFLFLGFVAALLVVESQTERRRDVLLAFLSGSLLSCAVVVDYTSAPASVLIALYALIGTCRWGRKRCLKLIASLASGAVIFSMPLFVYHFIAFGDPFVTGYKYHVIMTRVSEGFYGIRSPRIDIIAEILFGMRHGILWLSPILLLMPYALYKQWKTPGMKSMAVLILLIALSYIIWNSGYVYWTGGASTGPRLITPILPFLCLSLALLWRSAVRVLRIVIMFLAWISFLISLMSVSVSMFIQEDSNINIVAEYIIPKFLEANRLNTSVIVRLISPSYDGSSHLHLLPLYIVLAAGFVYIVWERKKYLENS